MKKIGSELHSILLTDKSSKRFLIGVVFGFAFSISIILATIGIMDGFELSLKKSLKLSGGDITISSRKGFFPVNGELATELSDYGVEHFSGVIQTEGFLVGEDHSIGVLVVGVEPEKYQKITGLELNLSDDKIVIGSELQKRMDLKVGEYASIAFAQTNKEVQGLPELFDFEISNVVSHGLYQKDLRVVYVSLSTLQKILETDDRVNLLSLRVGPEGSVSSKEMTDKVEVVAKELSRILGHSYVVRPFWTEFDFILKAVKAEKVMIALVLQIVVIISIFNIIAFIIFLNEKKIQEIFLLRTLGMGGSKLKQMWNFMCFMIWFLSCVLAIVFVYIFDYLLQNLDIFKLPGDVYHLGVLKLEIGMIAYIGVFAGAFIWMFILSRLTLSRIIKRPILEALRQEFS
ncbi:MacB-like periplasmic core domain protein [Bacteriovorax sp. BSW11_IV]|uniref:ABC transporter permease n=1 Tax=Bacteriovorax sp. BSW11_IV TaxID=1353529 RepID=UPI00038A0502|nr:ABC transporter permease [Bacteriovorax sp. BSW11_IV]EQC48935.1 MacB-like periplasmic core domain protein [Bacteriovorax sp. BSW11_IV]